MIKEQHMKLSAILQLHAALRQLDGEQKIVREGGAERTVRVPYAFDAQTRYQIAKNIAVVSAEADVYNRARDAIVRVHAAGAPEVPATAMPAFSIDMEDLVNRDVPVTLETFPFAKLKADVNAIPGSVIAVLLDAVVVD